MPRVKNYKSKRQEPEAKLAGEKAPNAVSLRIDLPRNPTSNMSIDLTPWLGKGFDTWVEAFSKVLKGRLDSGTYSPASLTNQARAGANTFFSFMLAYPGRIPSEPRKFTATHVAAFTAWLRLGVANKLTAHSRYSALKSLMSGMADFGAIEATPKELFSVRPFPKYSQKPAEERRNQPLSQTEMQRLASALKADLVAICRKRFDGPESEAMTAMALILAMRTGLNPTPLIEMSRDCLRPHPFMPNLMLIETFKRRGQGAQLTAVRQTQMDETPTLLPMDAVAVLRKAIEISGPLVAKAAVDFADRVWLYRSAAKTDLQKENVKHLTNKAFSFSIGELVKRHALLADDGSPLRVNLEGLRKTKANQLWRLSDGDLAAVSAAMGHTPRVADNHYLSLDEATKAESATFIGEALVEKLRSPGLVPTPTGHCKDSLHGARAPKDGSNHCADFTSCVGCPSFAVVATAPDLHRLFSFQQFLAVEAGKFESDEWAEWQRRDRDLIGCIDSFADAHFDAPLVAEARAMAQAKPHRFWAMQIERAAKGAGHG
jgi:integrase